MLTVIWRKLPDSWPWRFTEQELIVRMPPKVRYQVELEIKNIKRGKRVIVSPDEGGE